MLGSSVTSLVTQFGGQLGRTAIDTTALGRNYYITLKFAPDSTHQSDPDSPTIFSAPQELGLKLDSTKGPVEVLTVARIERPIEN